MATFANAVWLSGHRVHHGCRSTGLEDWLFDMDSPADVERVVPTVLALSKNPQAAAAKADVARRFVEQRQQETMAILARELGNAASIETAKATSNHEGTTNSGIVPPSKK